jgi:hypothetical protein
MPAERRSFSDPLEPLLYWDASVAIPDLFEGGIVVYTCLP